MLWILLIFLALASCAEPCSDTITYRGTIGLPSNCLNCVYEVYQCDTTRAKMRGFVDAFLTNYNVSDSDYSCRYLLDSPTASIPCLEYIYGHPLTIDECLDSMYANPVFVPSDNNCEDCLVEVASNEYMNISTIIFNQLVDATTVKSCTCYADPLPPDAMCAGASGGGPTTTDPPSGGGGSSTSAAGSLGLFF